MRDDTIPFQAASDPSEVEWRRSRAGRMLYAFCHRIWISPLLVMAILVPWPPWFRSVPTIKPARRAAGTSPFPIVSLAFGADGQTLGTTDESGQATLWRAAEGWSPVHDFEFHGRAKVVAFSSDGHYLAMGGDAPLVALWDLRRGNWEHSQQIPVRSTSNLKISPDGRALAVSSHDSPDILLWDLAAGRERLSLKGHSAAVMHMAFAPDGRSLASATGTIVDLPIRIWDVSSGRLQQRISELGSAPQAMAYSPDSTLLATACPHEKAVRIWDVRKRGQFQVISGHSLSTRSLAFSPDGRLLATGAGDGSAGLWSVATGREIRRLDGEAEVLRNVAFSPDGRTLAATANDGDIRFWDVDDLTGAGPVD
jgi:WD40 repeat protein